MQPSPRVSIVLPLFNDEGTVARALESCIAQSLTDLEIICVDDASTDGTAEVLKLYSAQDSRIKVIRHERNGSALQARRTGIEAASAPYLLFVDGDDELLPIAASKALAEAERSNADLVGFAVEVVTPAGRPVGGYQARLVPKHASLTGPQVLRGLFPVDQPAQGQLWRYLFSTTVLRKAYEMMPDGLSLPRVNDLPVMFLVAVLASRYVSIGERLYRYQYGQGGSGQRVDTIEQARFYADAIRSIDSIAAPIRSVARTSSNPGFLLDTYESARLSVVGYVTSYLLKHASGHSAADMIDVVDEFAPPSDVVLAAARFYPDLLQVLKLHTSPVPLGTKPVHSVMLVGPALTTDGVSAVLLAQAMLLQRNGFQVTVVGRGPSKETVVRPTGVDFVELVGRGLAERLDEWAALCRSRDADVIVDHRILHSLDWPEYALVAQSIGVPTIGWIHDFAGRPTYDVNGLHALLLENLPMLSTVVVPSRLDVAFWKLRGISRTVFTPSPPTPMLLESRSAASPRKRPTGPIRLLWLGRLDERTKRVSQLIDVAAALSRLSVNFHITVVGPDGPDFTSERFNAIAGKRGLSSLIEAVGDVYGPRLLQVIDDADALVSTSIIEGYQLTIAEAQARGLPVFMYELPWLTLAQDNHGIISVPQGESAELAREIAAVMESPDRYEELSIASATAAEIASSFDFAALHEQVITGALPHTYSPSPTIEDAKALIDWTIYYAELRSSTPTATSPKDHSNHLPTARSSSSTGSTAARRLWRSAEPAARTVLQLFPGLRPLARRVRHRFLPVHD